MDSLGFFVHSFSQIHFITHLTNIIFKEKEVHKEKRLHTEGSAREFVLLVLSENSTCSAREFVLSIMPKNLYFLFYQRICTAHSAREFVLLVLPENSTCLAREFVLPVLPDNLYCQFYPRICTAHSARSCFPKRFGRSESLIFKLQNAQKVRIYAWLTTGKDSARDIIIMVSLK